MVSAAVHPADSAWEQPKTIRNSPAQASTAPGQSIGGLTAGRLLRIQARAPTAAIAANTRLTYKHQRHDKYWVSTPPRISPTAPPPAATEPKTPKARPRSRGSRNVLTSVPRADGARTAPNAPCSARAATSIPNETAAPPMAEAIANPIKPVMKTHLRLNMSPSRPPTSSKLPKARA